MPQPLVLLFALAVSEIPPSSPWIGTGEQARLRPTEQQGRLVFEWRDAEDLVRGAVVPARPRAGEALAVDVTIEPLAGARYERAVTAVLRPLEQAWGGEPLTVWQPDATRHWRFAPTPLAPGKHLLELRWQSTGPKVLRAELDVAEAQLPPWLGPAAALLVVALGGGLSAALFLRGQRAEAAQRTAATAPLPPIDAPRSARASPETADGPPSTASHTDDGRSDRGPTGGAPSGAA